MSRLGRARAGVALGCALMVAGVLLLAGLGWALIAAGLVLAVSCLVLVDIDEPEPGEEAS
jgi:hypothetical protein